MPFLLQQWRRFHINEKFWDQKKNEKKRKGDKQIDQKSNTEYYWRIRENLIFKEQYWLQVSRLNTTCLFYMLQPSADLTKLRANWRADARIIQNASNKKSGYNRLHSLVVKFMRKVGGSSIDSIIKIERSHFRILSRMWILSGSYILVHQVHCFMDWNEKTCMQMIRYFLIHTLTVNVTFPTNSISNVENI